MAACIYYNDAVTEQSKPEAQQETDVAQPRRAVDYLALPFAPLIWAWDGVKAVGSKFFDLAAWLDPAKGLGALGRLMQPIGIRIATFLKPAIDAAHRVITFLFGWVAPLTDTVERVGRAVARRLRRLSAAVERATRNVRQAMGRGWRAAKMPAQWLSARGRAAWSALTRPIRDLAARLRRRDS